MPIIQPSQLDLLLFDGSTKSSAASIRVDQVNFYPRVSICHCSRCLIIRRGSCSQAAGWTSDQGVNHGYVPNADETYRRALEAGAGPVQEPRLQKGDTDRRAGERDSSGSTWWIAAQVEEAAAQEKLALPPQIILITGLMTSGKSSVAQSLAERLQKRVHLRGDVFRRMIVSGQAEMGYELSEEARQQLFEL